MKTTTVGFENFRKACTVGNVRRVGAVCQDNNSFFLQNNYI